MGRARFAFYCLCGDAMTGFVQPDSTDELRRAFLAIHQGTGHGPTDGITARRIRQRKERSR